LQDETGSTGSVVQSSGIVAGIVLAAGAGTRLRPLTRLRPKPLCPVANVPLVDLALERVVRAVGIDTDVAVNVHHGRELLEAHLAATGVHVSIEEERALGTAGAVGFLRSWLDGRAALVVNADTWCTADLGSFVQEWDGETARIMVAGDDPFGPSSRIVASLLPWSAISPLEAVPSGLYEVCWRELAANGAIDTVAFAGDFVDCGTPAQYLEANRRAIALAAGEAGSVIDPSARLGDDATVERSAIGARADIGGAVVDSVVWDGATVEAHEHLASAIRTDTGITVLVR
jgi:NDP-sugar pyrophosphorylase family protein